MGYTAHCLRQFARVNAEVTRIWLVHQGNHRKDALAAETVFAEPGDLIFVANHAWFANDRQF